MKGDRRQSPTKRGGENTRRGLPPGESRKYLFIGVTKTEHHAVKTYCAALGLEYNAWVRGLIFAAIDEGTIREARAQIHRNKPNGEPGEALPRLTVVDAAQQGSYQTHRDADGPQGPSILEQMAKAGLGISDATEAGATTMRDDYLAQPRSGSIVSTVPPKSPVDPETEF